MNVWQQVEEKFHGVIEWIESEIHGKVGDEVKADVSEIVEQGKRQVSTLVGEAQQAVIADVNLAKDDVHTATGDAGGASNPDTPAT